MSLLYRALGASRPFIILHGLYGLSDNWISFARALSFDFQFFIPDLRNHGKSPYSKKFDYEIMCNDLYEFINIHQIEKPILMGHSMGGKLAMKFAAQYPDYLSSLILLDISPLSYTKYPRKGLLDHQNIINSILNVNLKGIYERSIVETHLQSYLQDEFLCKLLMKNLKRKRDNTLFWALNLKSLLLNFNKLSEGILDSDFISSIPTLFIKADKSNYIIRVDIEQIKYHYPNAKIIELENASHWLYLNNPINLVNIIYDFLNNYIH